MTLNVVVFYDGNCGFCNRSIQFILKNQRNTTLRFAPLQSQFAEKYLKEITNRSVDFESIYLLKNGKIYSESTAVLHILPQIKWYWFPLYLMWLIPPFIRNFCYRIVAVNRHRLAQPYCVVTSENQRQQFMH